MTNPHEQTHVNRLLKLANRAAAETAPELTGNRTLEALNAATHRRAVTHPTPPTGDRPERTHA